VNAQPSRVPASLTDFEWFVAFRYLTARRKQAFISLISAVSILGVGVGVMALVVALALMTGVQRELRDRIVGSTAHIYVYKIGENGFADLEGELRRLSSVDGVVGAAPAVLGLGLASSSRADSEPINLKGIDPSREAQVTDITAALQSGSIAALANRPEGAHDGIVLGADLATKLGVRVGDAITVVTPQGTLTPMGLIPKEHSFQVVGTFRFGFYEFDTAYGLVSLQIAESLFRQQGPGFIQLRVSNLDDAPRVKRTLQERLGTGYQVQDWTELNRPLYSALWLEKVAISLTIGLIVMVAALNIVASLVLLVMEKSRDIAILRTMGAPARAIRRIFVLQGLTIGLTGTVVGTTLGLIVCWVADRYQLIKLPGDVYQITYLPFHVLPRDLALVVLSAIAVCLLATIYPSRQAGRLDPAEALRNQ
jgi:lipoprotein-releasing system permease protein